jgi:hypothetical protein
VSLAIRKTQVVHHTFLSLNIKDYFFMPMNFGPRNPFLVSESCFRTNMFNDKHVVTSGGNHWNLELHHPAVTMFQVKAGDWNKNGRAKNSDAQYQVRFFFGRIANSIADACKSIVHSFDQTLYSMAEQKFNQLSELTEFNTRHDINMRHYKYNPTREQVVDHYKSGFMIAHYFLRVFRHNIKLKDIVTKYHQAWLRSPHHEITLEEKVSLKSDLLSFLKLELKNYETFTRNKSEKAILEKQCKDPEILDAIHNTLIAMRGKVVFLWWCSEWKNEKLLFFDNDGPLTNLLRLRKHPKSSFWTTPTLQIPGMNLQITDIFSLQTCKSLSALKIEDWITLIKASCEGNLDEYLQWNESGKIVDTVTLKKDLELYDSDYVEDQDKYRDNNTDIPMWDQIHKQGFSFDPELPFCSRMQVSGLNTFDEPFITAYGRDWDGGGGKGKGKWNKNKGEGGRGFGRQGGKGKHNYHYTNTQDHEKVDIGYAAKNGGKNRSQNGGQNGGAPPPRRGGVAWGG